MTEADSETGIMGNLPVNWSSCGRENISLKKGEAAARMHL